MLFDGKQVEVKRTTYSNNDALAIVLVEEGKNEVLEVITTNIDATDFVCVPFSSKAFVDTNNFPDIEKFLKENELAEPSGDLGINGMYEYPLYNFNLDKIPVLPEYPDVDPDGDFLLEIEVEFEDKSVAPFELSIKKKGVEGIKDDVLPEVLKECKSKNITSGTLGITVTISQHGEWVDSDAAWFTLKDGELTMCDDSNSDDEDDFFVVNEEFDAREAE